MKVLLDEHLPHDLRLLIPMHDVYTVTYMKWVGVANGRLLATAATGGFDVLVTADHGYEYQQNLATLPCAVVLLLTRGNKIADVRPFVGRLLLTLHGTRPGQFVKLDP